MCPRHSNTPCSNAIDSHLAALVEDRSNVIAHARIQWLRVMVATHLAFQLTSCHKGQHRAGGDQLHGTATTDQRFDDVERWVERFENPARTKWQNPEHVIAVLDLPPDAKVADIGAATGFFPVRFARAFPQGKVYGIDVEEKLVNYLDQRARREGLDNITAINCAVDDPKIPEDVDAVFLCNTYHHIDARIDYIRALRSTLLPGGKVMVVDFYKKKLPIGPPPDHKLAADVVIREMLAAGYVLITYDKSLVYQYILEFQPRE